MRALVLVSVFILLLVAPPAAAGGNAAKVFFNVTATTEKYLNSKLPKKEVWDKGLEIMNEHKWRVKKGAETIADAIIHQIEKMPARPEKIESRDAPRRSFQYDASDHIQMASEERHSVGVRGGRLG